MALFVVRHQHAAETCPAPDPRMGSMLLQHLSPSNAANHRIQIHGEAVVNGAHTIYMIVDAPNEESVNRFMEPFSQAGSVEVLAASPCEAVVGRRAC
jgi:hypothetical protein